MKNAIVFGGSGFIGSHVGDALTQEGYETTIFDIKESPYLSKNQKFICGNILDKEKVEKAVKGHDVVYNFAGQADIDVAVLKPLETLNTNIIGNTNILEACRRYEVKRFVFASTVYVYSNAGSFYRSSKQACELIIENYRKIFNLDFTILRYGSLYGARSGIKNWLYLALQQALKENKITRQGDGKELREYIHIYDAAKLSVKILDEKYKNEYVMITGNQQLQIKHLMEMIKEIMGNRIKLEFVDSNEEQHYELTPYSFSPKLAKKIVGEHYIELGQGILNLIDEIYMESQRQNQMDVINNG